MISNKDLYLEEYYRNGASAEMAMHQEYEAWQAWQALLTWADDRIRQSEEFFLDLRQPGLEPVAIDPTDELFSEETNWFLLGDSIETEGREIPFLPANRGWRITA
jgi:hypothetical protein